MAKWAPIGCLLLLIYSTTALGHGKPTSKEPKVSVVLGFSVEEYDPSTPSKAFMTCVVRNDTAEAIQVPVRYDGKRIRLYSAGGLVLYRIKGDDLSRLERTIADLRRKVAAADDPEAILSLARRLAETIKTRKELEAQQFIRIEPGMERVVFEFRLDEILLHRKTKDGSLAWGWRSRLPPPKSPIYGRAGSRDLVSEASFTVRLEVGDHTVDSKQVHLKVKASD